MYYKNQFIIIIISTLTFLFTSFLYYQDRQLERNGLLSFHVISLQSCRDYKGSSSVHIRYKNKIYFIRMANGECRKYPVGSKIGLKYNDRFDYFYKPDGLKRDKNRLIFTATIFLISIIPWKKIYINKAKKELPPSLR